VVPNVTNQTEKTQQNQQNGNQPNQPATPGAENPNNGKPSLLLNQPLNDQLNSATNSQAVNNPSLIAAGPQTDQGMRQKLLVAPAQQTVQYQEMQKKYSQMEADRGMSEQEAAQAYNN